jgi:hypothetical protein
MSRKFSDWNLVRGLLELKDLLVDELAFLVDDKIWVHRTVVRDSISTSPTSPGQCDACEATSY